MQNTAERAGRRGAVAALWRVATHRWRGGDEAVGQRVRAEVATACDDPGAVQVEAHDGRVTLRGTATGEEAARLRRVVPVLRGVRQLDDRLAVGGRRAG